MLKSKILNLKEILNVTIAAHFYQRDEVFEIADITGDSLELAKKIKDDKSEFLIFCGVGFMGESVKILSPNKRVLMPRIASCSMAEMIEEIDFNKSVKFLKQHSIDEFVPITYINSSALIKAEVGRLGGLVCTSSNAKQIIEKTIAKGKKILFIPDRCLGQNVANSMGLKSSVIGDGQDPKEMDIICYNGFCAVHQLFTIDDIDFYKKRYSDIEIISHPECPPEVVNNSDFVGSTSQIIEYVNSLPKDKKIAVATEFNLVNRLRENNTYILSSTKAECPTMNETTLDEVYRVLKSIEEGNPINEIFVDEDIRKNAFLALDRMFKL